MGNGYSSLIPFKFEHVVENTYAAEPQRCRESRRQGSVRRTYRYRELRNMSMRKPCAPLCSACLKMQGNERPQTNDGAPPSFQQWLGMAALTDLLMQKSLFKCWEYRHPRILSILQRGIGVPLRIGRGNTKRNFGYFARILVDVDRVFHSEKLLLETEDTCIEVRLSMKIVSDLLHKDRTSSGSVSDDSKRAQASSSIGYKSAILVPAENPQQISTLYEVKCLRILGSYFKGACYEIVLWIRNESIQRPKTLRNGCSWICLDWVTPSTHLNEELPP
ncbi:hypothetical protein FNV43_RR17084 [Rhamnella rubrinervis]|uniref:Uncharacterized protein n=1 Tax=Rhamnella rubrinervis TaxID=2594499 RepID=A0A8K0H046_9ROSA|nr:hypothetical protein FNV43_RR17084 [Rhamnella rubrinervis]